MVSSREYFFQASEKSFMHSKQAVMNYTQSPSFPSGRKLHCRDSLHISPSREVTACLIDVSARKGPVVGAKSDDMILQGLKTVMKNMVTDNTLSIIQKIGSR